MSTHPVLTKVPKHVGVFLVGLVGAVVVRLFPNSQHTSDLSSWLLKPKLGGVAFWIFLGAALILFFILWRGWHRQRVLPRLGEPAVQFLLVLCLALLLVGALSYAADWNSTASPGVTLSAVFGLASWAGLVFSFLVFVELRKKLDELEILREMTRTIARTQKKLWLLSLSPNIGLRACVERHDLTPFSKFRVTLESKLKSLKGSNASDVCVCYLLDRPLREFYDGITRLLPDGWYPKTESAYKSIYKEATDNLDKVLTVYKSVAGQPDAGWLKQWKDVNESQDYPALSLVLTDDRAVVFFNASFKEGDRTLRGIVFSEREEIDSFHHLADLYRDKMESRT